MKAARAILVGAMLCAAPMLANAATVSSSFDSSAEGWVLQGGALAFVASGGNPGGHLQSTDQDSSSMTLVAPATYVGLVLKDGGTLQFDFREITVTGPDAAFAGTVTLSGGGLYAQRTVITVSPSSGWATYSATLQASDWGVTQTAWNTIIADISAITVNVEGSNGAGEVTGFDNFSVETVPAVIPAPAGLPLLAGALGVAWARSRRRRV